MNKPNLACVLLIFFILLTSSLHAQTVANFSGSWLLDTAKCDPGPGGYIMDKDQILKITQNATSITFARTYPSSGNFTSANKYSFDGKVRTQKKDYGTDKTTVQWSVDKKVLTITTVTTAETKIGPDDFLVADSWKLSKDGRMLINESRSENKQLGKRTVLMVYQKQ